jgi:ABC-2 type transport system ATP-binding protein
MNAVEIRHITKKFGAVEALSGISFNVKEGEIYGLVGPDGAGKTTLIRILTGIMSAGSGSAFVGGIDVLKDPESIKHIIGYMSQRFSLYGDLSVSENMQFYADLFEVPQEERKKRIKKLLQFSRLGEFLDRRADALSGGMKQKLGLSCALIHTPRILFLDEPTTGVDPVSRRELWMILYDLWKDGMTILVSTPYLDEAERCSRVGFINKGRLVLEGTPEEIKKAADFSVIEARIADIVNSRKKLIDSSTTKNYLLFGENLHFISEDAEKDKKEIQKFLSKAGIECLNIRQIEPTLEDVFLRSTSESKAGE